MLRGVSRESKLSHPDLHVTRTQAGHKERTIYKVTGLAPGSSLGIFNADLRTLECALLERMYFCQVGDQFLPAPEPTHQTVAAMLRPFTKALNRRVKLVTVKTLEEVVESYSGRKRAIYANALTSLGQYGLNRTHAYSNSFVKVEKGNTAKAPRCIQPRKPEYNLALARYIKPLEHRMYKWIGQVFGDGPTVMKGYNVQEVARIARAKWNNTPNCVCVGLDATKFDMHVSPAMLKWEHGIYKRLFKHSPDLARLLSWQMDNIGRGFCEDGKLRYKVKGKRFSGDMNTALGNCLIMCAMVYCYALERGVPVKLMNNGDDCMVFMEEQYLARFMEEVDSWFLGCGFRMTVEPPVRDFEQIEFCQMRPIRTSQGWTMVRNIGTALAKDTMSVVPLVNEKVARKWMHAVGECGLALCSGVPILQNFYSAYLREGIAEHNLDKAVQMASGMRMMSHGLESKIGLISDESRLGVYVAWGITPEEQIAIEQHFDGWQYAHEPTEQVDIPTLFNGLRLSW